MIMWTLQRWIVWCYTAPCMIWKGLYDRTFFIDRSYRLQIGQPAHCKIGLVEVCQVPTVAEFLNLTHCFRNSATFPDLYNRPQQSPIFHSTTVFCGCPRYLCSEGTRTWVSPMCCTAQLTVSYMLMSLNVGLYDYAWPWVDSWNTYIMYNGWVCHFHVQFEHTKWKKVFRYSNLRRGGTINFS